VFRAPTDPPLSSATGQGAFGCAGCVPDTVNGARCVRDLYEQADDKTGAGFGGRGVKRGSNVM